MQLPDIPEVYREHFKECLEHFGQSFNKLVRPGSRGRRDHIIPMAEFCGVSVETAHGWLSSPDVNFPNGETAIKLACYLSFHGYKIIDFERLPTVLRGFAELLGYGVISVSDALKVLNFSKTSHLYFILWDKTGTSQDKSDAMYRTWKDNRDQLNVKKQQAFDAARMRIFDIPPVANTTPVVPTIPESNVKPEVLPEAPAVPVEVSSNISDSLVVSVSVAMMLPLLTLFEQGPLGKLSEADLSKMRALGGYIIPKLTDQLNQLNEKLKGTQNAQG
jgi:hypothetical protein